jgi:hypothetical protein
MVRGAFPPPRQLRSHRRVNSPQCRVSSPQCRGSRGIFSGPPNYWHQSVLVAKNPVVAARFLNLYMKAFISALLGYDPDQKNLEGGILGVVKAYYGCVEAQGRGTLHWVEGEKDTSPPPPKKKVNCIISWTLSATHCL